MPLYMATHTVQVVTAKVQLSCIMLNDFVKRKAIPEQLKLRMVIPTSGAVSVSLWDSPTPDELLAWLQENVQYDATHEVHEVVEEFSYGLNFEMTRLRTADKVAAGSRQAVDRITATAAKAGGTMSRQLEALDQRTNLITAAGDAFSRMRSAASGFAAGAGASGPSATAPSAGATGGVYGVDGEVPPAHAAGGATTREGVPPAAAHPGTSGTATETLAATQAAVTAGLAKAGSTLSWLGSTLKEQLRTAAGTPAAPPTAPGGAAAYGSGGYYTAPPTAAAAASGAPPSAAPPSHAHPVHAFSGGSVASSTEDSVVLPPVQRFADSHAPAAAAVAAAVASSGPPPSLPASQPSGGLEPGLGSVPSLPVSSPAAAPPAPPTFTLDEDDSSPAKAGP